MSNQGVTYKTDKIMPTWEQLAEIGRDLRFYPSTTEQPKVLTQEQGMDFNRDLGHLTPRHSTPDDNSVLGQIVEDAEQYGETVNVELKAGEISIHTDLLLHGSNANPSPKRRCGLTLRYCSSDVRASYRWDREGVVVSGEDRNRNWGNPPRPAID